MKKVLFLIPTLSHGGAEKVLVNLVNHLDHEKYEITVKTILDIGVNKKYLNKNINYKSLFKRYFKGSTLLLKLFPINIAYNLFVEDDYDIEISYLEGAAARLISGKKKSNNHTKKIAWIHTEFFSKADVAIGFRDFFESKKCYESFDQVACVSEKVKDGFLKFCDLPQKTKVLYNTNDTKDIIGKSRQEIKDVKFNNDVINIISVGKIIPSKNFLTLAKIHKRLMDEGIKTHFYILGTGPEQKNIQEFLDENNISDTFSFLGYKENPYKYVANADLYVCSSLREGFSTAVTESLIVGTPVVTTLCSGMKEMLGENNEYGLITENNEEDLFEGVKRLTTDPYLLTHYKQKAIERGLFFSTEKTVAAVEDLLDNLGKEAKSC